MLLFIFVFVGLSIRCAVDDCHVFFLVDESRSIDGESRKFINSYLQNSIASNKKFTYSFISFARTPKLSASIVEFAQQKSENAQIQDQKNSEIDTNWRDETNIASAIDLAEELRELGGNYNIVLISDGNETIGNSLQSAVHCKIPISTVPIPESKLPEISVSKFNVPFELKSGEPFNMDLNIHSNQPADVAISIFRNEFKIYSSNSKLVTGENKFRFQQTASDERLQEFSVKIESVQDTINENNYARKLVMTGDQPHILAIDSNVESLDNFAAAMFEQGLKVEVRPIEGIPKTADKFMQFDAIIISDVPAAAFSLQQMDLIREYVYDFGGGLIMIGGENSFGQGGYYKTVIEDILPVRCNFDDEKEKSPVAISLVLDRSGSMSGEKIKTAQDAAKGVIDLLSANDFISIIAYDAIPHVVVPSQKITSPSTIRATINSLTSGGGTNIYLALQESYEQLSRLNTSSKHVILLTDGKSGAGDFDVLLKRMVADGITVTVICIGEEDDGLLKRIAELSNGRFYQIANPNSVPQIFANETMLSNKSAVSEMPFIPIIVTKNTILDGILIDRIPTLLGFVRTKAKTTSKIILATESGEPLLNWQRYGIGIAAAFTSDVKNHWAAEWIVWNDFAKLWSQIIRFTMQQQKSNNSVIECKFADGQLEVIVDILDADERFIDGLIGMLTIIMPDLLKQKIPFEQIAAGRYKATFDTNSTQSIPNPVSQGNYLLQMQLQTKEQQTVLQHSRGIVVDNLDELRGVGVNIELLRRISELTGGTFNPDPADILSKQNKPVFKNFSLRPYLLAAIILLFLLDVFLRRKLSTQRH
ncbi:MAG: VWA domain-containing protein [Planctomycetaceae bacterium]|nr:VWA domain-containing protein [Planctomycetaceae bacterium]